MALSPRSGLFGPGKSLITRLRRDQVTEPITLAVARMKTMPWAIYRVRRLYYAPANAARSVDSVLLGGHRTVHTVLTEVSRLVDIPLTKNEEIAGAPAGQVVVEPDQHVQSNSQSNDSYQRLQESLTVDDDTLLGKVKDTTAAPSEVMPIHNPLGQDGNAQPAIEDVRLRR